MKLADVVKALDLNVFCGKDVLEKDAKGGYVSDLLSDVMGGGKESQVWITIQNHKNVVAIASLKDMAAIILAKGIEPDEDMLSHAFDEEIPVLGSKEEVFTLTGKLFLLLGDD